MALALCELTPVCVDMLFVKLSGMYTEWGRVCACSCPPLKLNEDAIQKKT